MHLSAPPISKTRFEQLLTGLSPDSTEHGRGGVPSQEGKKASEETASSGSGS